MDISLTNKRILITGGATGLGLAMAREFAKNGAKIILCSRTEEQLLAAKAGLETQFSTECEVHVCDIRQAAAIHSMFDSIQKNGPIDILVNNAAASFVAKTERLSTHAVDAVLATTLHGTLYCTLEAGKRWIAAAQPGLVLSILSTSVVNGRAFTMPSSVAKAGVASMIKSLAVEWGRYGIRLIGLAPGPFNTLGSQRQLDPLGYRAQRTTDEIPLGRFGKLSELAGLATFLVSDMACYINGAIIIIDGGWHLRTSGVEDLIHWSDDQWERLKRR